MKVFYFMGLSLLLVGLLVREKRKQNNFICNPTAIFIYQSFSNQD